VRFEPMCACEQFQPTGSCQIKHIRRGLFGIRHDDTMGLACYSGEPVRHSQGKQALAVIESAAHNSEWHGFAINQPHMQTKAPSISSPPMHTAVSTKRDIYYTLCI
jgi:hypothetical protein